MVGTRVIINESNQIHNDLWGLTGVIDDVMTTNRSETREFYGRDESICPDEVDYWIKFDKPVNNPSSNVNGWVRMWLKLEHFTVIN